MSQIYKIVQSHSLWNALKFKNYLFIQFTICTADMNETEMTFWLVYTQWNTQLYNYYLFYCIHTFQLLLTSVQPCKPEQFQYFGSHEVYTVNLWQHTLSFCGSTTFLHEASSFPNFRANPEHFCRWPSSCSNQSFLWWTSTERRKLFIPTASNKTRVLFEAG